MLSDATLIRIALDALPRLEPHPWPNSPSWLELVTALEELRKRHPTFGDMEIYDAVRLPGK